VNYHPLANRLRAQLIVICGKKSYLKSGPVAGCRVGVAGTLGRVAGCAAGVGVGVGVICIAGG